MEVCANPLLFVEGSPFVPRQPLRVSARMYMLHRLRSLARLTSPDYLRFHPNLPRGGSTRLEAEIYGRDLHLPDVALLHPDAMRTGVVGPHIAISTVGASSACFG